jgi:hypothetical protein
VAEAEPVELLRSLTMNVARVGHLLALKVLSRDNVARPQDIADFARFCGGLPRRPSCGARKTPRH